MKVGFLHAGPKAHGVVRYGEILAKKMGGNEVTIKEVTLSHGSSLIQSKESRETVKLAFKEMDIVHVQASLFNQLLWGGGYKQIVSLAILKSLIRKPLVITLHDLIPTFITSEKLQQAWRCSQERVLFALLRKQEPKSFVSRMFGKLPDVTSVWDIDDYDSSKLYLNLIARCAKRCVVFSSSGKSVAQLIIPIKKIECIPHFIEPLSLKLSQSEAKRKLNLSEFKLVTLLGYIVENKGHSIALEALTLLPPNVKLVFAGGPCIGYQGQVFLQTLKEKGEALNISDRLIITGYLEQDKLNQYIAASDVGICPFKEHSASGSLSLWLAAQRPIVGSNSEIFDQYYHQNAFIKFEPYTAPAFAKAIMKALALNATQLDAQEEACQALVDRYSIEKIAEQHRELYSSLLR